MIKIEILQQELPIPFRVAQTHRSAKLKEFPTKYVLRDRQWLSSLTAEVNKSHEDNFVALNSNQWSICEKKCIPGFRLKQTSKQTTSVRTVPILYQSKNIPLRGFDYDCLKASTLALKYILCYFSMFSLFFPQECEEALQGRERKILELEAGSNNKPDWTQQLVVPSQTYLSTCRI